ncbi:MAG: hypothetical protein WAX69_09460 [Victivallales bacterium]
MASASLLPEINFEKTKVVHIPSYWIFASDHRPVFVTINTGDEPSWAAKDAIEKYFSDGIRKIYQDAGAGEKTDQKKNSNAGNGGRAVAVCFMDADGFSSSDPQDRKDAMASDLKLSGAEIIVLSGIKDAASADEIRKMLPGFKLTGKVEGADKESIIAVISRISPDKFEALTDIKYKIEDTEMPVSKGFAHAVFSIDGYKFHLIGADLKDRRQHPEYNQTDMRRYEARQLRYLVNGISKAEPGSNILVVGNFNDTCGMSPLKELYNRRSGIEKRLFDIRPVDPMKTTWTSWNRETDDYERTDYALASFSMVTEIVRGKTTLVPTENWKKFLSHRPLLVTISCKDVDKPLKESLDKEYPHCIYSGEAAHFEEDREIGSKPERNKAANPDDD